MYLVTCSQGVILVNVNLVFGKEHGSQILQLEVVCTQCKFSHLKLEWIIKVHPSHRVNILYHSL